MQSGVNNFGIDFTLISQLIKIWYRKERRQQERPFLSISGDIAQNYINQGIEALIPFG